MPASIQDGRSANHTLRIVCPNGHLGFAPIKPGSFRIGCRSEPDLICADSGSCDVGPVPPGADISSSDLETMLLASRRLGVPMIVGSAGDTGTNSRVDLFVGIIRDLAREHGLDGFHLGYFYSEVSREALRRRLVAGHAMYERANPFYEYFLGGRVDMSRCHYEQYDDRTVRVTGPKYIPASELRVKLEGSGKIGERYVGIVGVRDPYTIANIDLVTAWARQQVVERFGDSGYELHFTIYGRNAILGDREPLRATPAHELGIVVQGVAPTKAMAKKCA